MEEKIFLEENRSEFSNNVENAINVALSTKTRLLPNNDLKDNFSLFEQYNKERDNCNSFRLILEVNPICSNILFNKKTEVVLNEGSSDCVTIRDDGGKIFDKDTYAKNALNTSPITYKQIIRDTEYSHSKNGGFVYHCGSDIFNNHMLRKKNFIHVNKYNTTSMSDSKSVYNTIRDYKRDSRGDIVTEKININYKNKNKGTKMHLYQYDTIMSMPLAFIDNCIEKDGWWGFTNPGTIDIENNDDNININRMMADNKSCEFIDLYPDRSLFSFVPKFNKYRFREEKNWDYCITYPYAKDADKINKICGGEKETIKANLKKTVNTSSTPIVECSSYFKHNLKAGDYVTFYYYLPHKQFDRTIEMTSVLKDDVYNLYYYEDVNSLGIPIDNAEIRTSIPKDELEFVRYNTKVKVVSIGDSNGENKDKIFSVKYSDVQSFYNYMKYFGCFYKKNSRNTDCLYYFRKFKKLKNYDGDDLKNDINKIAFGKNIYGDDTAQIIFTDDINIDGLVDHNGRPVSEIFFTIVKRNKGYEKWYTHNSDINGLIKDEDIEFSHCFGEVTSGIDFSGIENEPFDYNIHYLHNIESGYTMTQSKACTMSAWGETILSGVPKTLEKDISINNDEFYGDIVEYDIANATETVIGNVYHRFNTAQRESWDDDFKNIYQDVITSDDYDEANGSKAPFKVSTYYINDAKKFDTEENEPSETLMFGNISPEGYFYNPHIKISVKENNDGATNAPAKLVNYNAFSFKRKETFLLIKKDGSIKFFDNIIDLNNEMEDGDEKRSQEKYYEITITFLADYGFYKGDFIAFYNNKTLETSWGEIISVNGDKITLKFPENSFSTIKNLTSDYFSPISGKRCLYAFWSPNNVPTYAMFSDGMKKFVWRTTVPPSEMMQDDKLYDLPFTNGRFYIEKNINFFLKRQDPNGKYGLSRPMYKRYSQTLGNPMLKYNISGYSPIDLSDIMYTINDLTNTCY